MRFTNKQIIFGILLVAFLLRFPGIFEGLPAAYNSTEYYHAKLALSMGARQSLDPQINNYDVYNPRLFIYPMLYQYLVLVQFAVLYIFGNIFGLFKDSYDFAVKFLVDPSIFYIANRLINVLISIATIYSFYTVLRKIYNETIARFASIISAISYYLILASIQSVSDSLILFFSTLTILFVLKSYFDPIQKNFLLAAIFAGLSIAVKYNAGVLLIMFPVLLWMKRYQLQNKLIRLSALICVVVFISFIIPNPYWLVRFSQFVDGFKLIASQANQAITPEMGLNYWWEFSQIAQHELLIGIGFFVSVIYFLFKKQKEVYILNIMTIIVFLYVGSWQKKGIDYFYAVYPVFIFLFSLFLYKIWSQVEKKTIIRYSIILTILIPSFLMAMYQNVLRLNMDTRERATYWVINNINKDDKVCYDNYHYDLGVFDINRFTDYGAGSSQLPKEIKQRLIDFKNHKRNIFFVPVIYKLERKYDNTGTLYEKESNQYARRTINELLDDGVQYLITNDWYFKPFLEAKEDNLSPVVKSQVNKYRTFYHFVFKHYKPVIVFEPDFWSKGPRIHIYNLNLPENKLIN
jgi:hypothetical protein